MMAYDNMTAQRSANLRSKGTETTLAGTGIPLWDMMFSLGRASQQMLSAYAPRGEIVARSGTDAGYETTSNVEVIPVGEETLNVGTRRVAGETTRVRRVVVETPVEQGISLREERVVVERRKPTGAASTATQAILTETAVEMSDSFEVVDVWKSVRVTEEVVLRREVTERHETVRDTVRRDEVVVEQARRAIPAPHHEAQAARHDQHVAASPTAERPEPAQMAADLKKVAERFEAKADQQDKTPATPRPETGAFKADQKPVASQPLKTAEQTRTAEQAKVPGRPETNVTQNDKGSSSPKA